MCFLLEDFRQTEVQNLDLAVLGLLDVGRFEIAMNNPFLVRRLERLGDLGGDLESLVYRNRSP